MASPEPVSLTLTGDDRRFLKKLVDEHGLHGVSKLLDISRGVVSSAVAGIPIRRGSIEMLKIVIGKHRENGVTK